MNKYIHKDVVLTAVVHWGILLSFTKVWYVSNFSKSLFSFLNLLRLIPGVEAKINCSYSEALLFVWLKDCSPQVEVKSRKTKENGISHLWQNSLHSSDEGNPHIKTNLHTGCFRKIAKKRGTQIASWAHIYIWRLALIELEINNIVFPIFFSFIHGVWHRLNWKSTT